MRSSARTARPYSAPTAGPVAARMGRCAGKSGRQSLSRPTPPEDVPRDQRAIPPSRAPRLFSRGSFLEPSRTAEILRAETTGGLLLIAGAVVALVWANTPWASSYEALRELRGGPDARCTSTSASAPGPPTACSPSSSSSPASSSSASSSPATCATPGGPRSPSRQPSAGSRCPPRSTPWSTSAPTGALRGWAIPTATDIAFAVAILAVISTHLPSGPAHLPAHPGRGRRPARHHDHRALLHLRAAPALARTAPCCPIARVRGAGPEADLPGLAADPAGPGGLGARARLGRARHRGRGAARLHRAGRPQRRGRRARRRARAGRAPRAPGAADLGRASPCRSSPSSPPGSRSAGFSGLVDALRSPVALGIVVALVVGKTVGIAGSTWLLATFTRADLDDELAWIDVIGMSMLAGVGLHRVAAHRRAGLRRRQRARRPGQDRACWSARCSPPCSPRWCCGIRNRVYRRICEDEERRRRPATASPTSTSGRVLPSGAAPLRRARRTR